MMAADGRSILGQAQTSVVFFDEGQRLNPVEAGTREYFVTTAARLQMKAVFRQLSQPLRCAGGKTYHVWVEQVIGAPLPIPPSIEARPWTADYEFAAVQSVGDLMERLKAKTPDHKVITAAS